jgi:hypothetical protein
MYKIKIHALYSVKLFSHGLFTYAISSPVGLVRLRTKGHGVCSVSSPEHKGANSKERDVWRKRCGITQSSAASYEWTGCEKSRKQSQQLVCGPLLQPENPLPREIKQGP